MKRYCCLFLVFFSLQLFAHNPDEVNYEVVVNDDTQQLVIHFTQITAIRLVQHIKPELKNEMVVKLEDYLTDFEAYFNKTIGLNIDKKSVYFQLIKNNLNAHDATLTFTLRHVKQKSSTFQIKVTSFLEVFKRIKNMVSIDLNGKAYNCSLNKNSISCSATNQVVCTEESHQHYTSYYMLGIVLIGVLSFG